MRHLTSNPRCRPAGAGLPDRRLPCDDLHLHLPPPVCSPLRPLLPSRRRRREGSFAYEDQFTVEPGDAASCSFPIAFDLQVRGTYQVFPDVQGQPVRLLLHEHWTGTGTANGKYVIEHAAQNDTVDLVTGANSNTGQIHDQVPFGGVAARAVAGAAASTPAAASASASRRMAVSCLVSRPWPADILGSTLSSASRP